jgi:hypothetical protein
MVTSTGCPAGPAGKIFHSTSKKDLALKKDLAFL